MRTIFRTQSWQAACLAASLALAPAVFAQQTSTLPDTPPPEIAHAKALSKAFQWVAKRVDPSVVHIAQLNRVRVGQNFFERGRLEQRQTGVGSGVIVSDNGTILTNHHVVAGAEALSVKLADGREVPATVVGSDALTDLAVIKVEASGLTPVEWGDSEQLEVGEWVVAVGSPFGLDNSVTAGIVSATGRFGIGLPQQEDSGAPRLGLANQDFIQTDAAINPGNSGGPLVTLEGKLIGINSAIATRSGGSDGIGFAIPASIARPVMDTLIQYGEVRRGWLGIRFGNPTPDGRGIRIDEVISESPAAASGFKVGDVITGFQGRGINNLNRLRNAIALTRPGSPVDFSVNRGGREQTITVSLADAEFGQLKALGLTEVSPLRAFVANYAKNGIEGAQVAQFVGKRDEWPEALRPGDVIVGLMIGRREMSTTNAAALNDALAGYTSGQSARLLVYRPAGRGFQSGYVDVAIP